MQSSKATLNPGEEKISFQGRWGDCGERREGTLATTRDILQIQKSK